MRSTTTGTWSDAPLPLRSSRSTSAGHRARPRGGQVGVVDAHALVPREPQPLVVPVGVGVLGGQMRAGHLGVPGGGELRERVALGRRDVRVPGEGRRVPHVRVERGHVPVTDERDLRLRVLLQPAARLARQGASQASLYT